ncbi:MAG: 2-dehydropantoate 2-reductase [Anaerolineales bacterium]|nr:2-dehydropantoate 2-reductase [Anaerolineae bacterium]PWB54141.1 MAG: 2-dehydropantoate 2-reductase [Anaerolineales bacterium]
MDILIVGTGAMASLFAARLAGCGISVTMLGSWMEGLTALKSSGVRLRELDGTEHRCPVIASNEEEIGGSYSQVLVLVKSWQTARAATQLHKLLTSTGIALTLQNGLGNYETLVKLLGEERVALGVTTLAAQLLAPGYVMHTGEGIVNLGTHPRQAVLQEMLVSAGFQVETVADPKSLLWGKLVINAAINPLTAILGVPNGELLTQPDTRELLSEVATEAEFVAYHNGVRLPYPDPIEAVEQVARNTAANHSSMLQDVLNGRPTEIDSINGAIVHEAEKVGIPTPVNRVLWHLVKGLDSKVRRDVNEVS